MKKSDIRKKLIGALVICMACMITIMPVTAFAQSNENADKEKVEATIEPTVQPTLGPTAQPNAEPTKEPTKEPEEEKKETYGPLTPDGNMSLVDDYGSFEAGGKQFITLVTKSGNYFYIIIDRDDQGQETVHFLNMVDESDLLKLMKEEEAKEYMESTTGKEEPVPTETVSSPTDAKDETTEEKNKDVTTEKKSITGILLLVLLVTLCGIGGYIFLKGSKKKTAKSVGPDPDADYIDEEEDYLAEFEQNEEDETDYEGELSVADKQEK